METCEKYAPGRGQHIGKGIEAKINKKQKAGHSSPGNADHSGLPESDGVRCQDKGGLVPRGGGNGSCPPWSRQEGVALSVGGFR